MNVSKYLNMEIVYLLKMKILVFTSRYTASRDIINEDFGRQVRLFEQLGKLGHEIDFFCADYKKFENKNVSLHNLGIFIRPFRPLRLFSFLLGLGKIIKSGNYDLVIATSDPLWGIIGYFTAKKYGIKFVYDVQDNYLVYKSYKMPFLGLFERHVVRNSDLVMCASNILADNTKKIRKTRTITIPNGVDTEIFRPLGMADSRKMLKLPADAKIISYIGSIQRIQGVDILIKAFDGLRKEIRNIRLMIAGRVGTVVRENFDLGKEGMIYLGSLPQEKVAYAINASDVLVIPYPKNKFTEVMFAPYKLVEFMACNRPVVVTDAGEMHRHIKDKRMVAKAGDAEDLKEKIKYALKLKKVNSRNAAMKFEWKNIAGKLDEAIKE
jgi:glycosyltransferase involved in cell wall biosynthesis